MAKKKNKKKKKVDIYDWGRKFFPAEMTKEREEIYLPGKGFFRIPTVKTTPAAQEHNLDLRRLRSITKL